MKEHSLTIEKKNCYAPALVQKTNNEESYDRINGDFTIFSNQSSNFSSAFSSAATDPNQKNNSLSGNNIQRFFIQPKLTIGQSNDKYGQKADRVSDQVIRMPENLAVKSFPNHIQRQQEEKLLQSKPLVSQIPPWAQKQTGEEGPLQAKHVFRNENNIHFNKGKYSPETSQGKQLLAHELTHVAQQGNANHFVQSKPREATENDKIRQYLIDGGKAIAYTREKLKLGMGNFKNDYSDPRTKKRLKEGYDLYGKDKKGNEYKTLGTIGAIGALYLPEVLLIIGRMMESFGDQEIKDKIAEARKRGDTKEVLRLQQKAIERTAALGERLKFGNCAEHASICYLYLRDHTKSRPLEMMLRPDHAFVVLGRLPVNSIDPGKWGNSTVICDAYYNEIYLLTNGVLHAQQAGANQYQARLES